MMDRAPMKPWLDRKAARRWFERAATGTDADHLAREVERRMASRLQYVKHDPARVVDVGCGLGASLHALRTRYPRAEWIGVDFAYRPVHRAREVSPVSRRLRSFLHRAREHFVCGDMSALPLATGSCAMVWSNLALAWSVDFAVTLREWHRVLEVGGLLMFATYGPDTLIEMRQAFAAIDPSPHVHGFVDMHDLGDTLVASGFADPVMDMERLTVTHSTVAALIGDLRATGERNARADRRRALTGRQRWQRMVAHYAMLARDERLPATFEIVYGHAWKAAPKMTADGRAIVQLDLRKTSRKTD
jgi:malonyl-CoA O-methyltransferase